MHKVWKEFSRKEGKGARFVISFGCKNIFTYLTKYLCILKINNIVIK